MKQITLKKIPQYVVLSILFLTFLTGFRWIWSETFSIPEHPKPTQGVLDLRGWDLTHASPISLDGEWEFIPHALLSGREKSVLNQPSTWIQVPGDWRSVLPSSSSFGYGTYRIRILLDPSVKEISLWAQKIQAASIIEMNGTIVAEFGQPASRPEAYQPERTAFTASYAPNGANEIELLVQTANFDDPSSGGITRSLYFGSPEAIASERGLSIDLQKITFAILLLHSLYACVMFFFNRKQRALLTFSLLTLAAAITVASDHDSLLLNWAPLNFTWMVKAKALSYPLFSFFMLLMARSFSHSLRGRRLFRIYASTLGVYCVFLLIAPVTLIYQVLATGISDFLYLFAIAWSVYLFFRMAVRKERDASFLLFAATSSFSSVLWGFVNSHNEITNVYYPIDVIAAIFGFSTYWFKKYFRNSNEIEKLYEQLKEEDRQKDQFLVNTAHELRTPLHGIINIAESIAVRERRGTGEMHAEEMKLLITIGRRMSQLVDDLLDVIRLKEKRITLQKKPLSLASVIPGVMGMFKFMAEGRPIQMNVDIPDSLPLVQADERRLVQILYNLLHNALKFTEEGTITVSVREREECVVILVSDSGVGISEQMQRRIFDAYEQGTPEARLSGGIGLGLSISKQLTELHGGHLTVQSVLGQGSTFQVSLPLGDTAFLTDQTEQEWDLHRFEEVAVAEQQPISQERAVAHILAVDDDPVNLRVLISMLSNEPYHIQTAASAREALELLDSRPWDLLIADVMMPHMSGYELTENVRKRYSVSELPILLLTARNESADIHAGFMAGATDYVTKPVDAVELKHRIRSLAVLKQSIDERLRMEAAYLQAQIQPHFLFNTLNSIMALSDLDTERMQKLGDAFIHYLQTSFHFLNAEKTVDIAHEIDLARTYVYIEKERFPDRLEVLWDIPQDLSLSIPPLTIQPLIENAVRHGVLSKRTGGTVQIRIIEQDDQAIIEVQDDGVGMSQAQIDNALEWPKKNPSGSGGVGLTNTHRRLNQRYGQGLTIRSSPGEGTTISFVIPFTPSR
ncbi:hybrid sensor histidine kinase/response regulator [Paenibacillus pabuli]|uniref:hybrid sensor histidine kinase/response regulator n=1 Tax=Paenibacillus pabuli TaxID=1472 RepID=UPI0007810BC9|nr:ATP-binding protein [Paenibacillus pabuli]MEC0123256.1 ATP-binding protein [Paenibacillus pabuli]